MFKGHAKIELKNPVTGKREVVEGDNMFTNALSTILNHYSAYIGEKSWSDMNSNFLPLYDKALGGIFLFQNALEERADNVAIPSKESNPLIGYASDDAYSGEDTRRGSRNLTETEVGEHSVKYVWDFATSQANGQISALALTSKNSGKGLPFFGKWINGFLVNWTRGSNDQLAQYIADAMRYGAVDFDYGTRILRCIVPKTTTVVTVVDLLLMDFYRIGINKPFDVVPKIVNQQDIALGHEIALDSAIINGWDGFYYIVKAYSYNSVPLSVCRINALTLEYDTDFGYKTYTFSETNFRLSVLNIDRNFAMISGKAVCRCENSSGYKHMFLDLDTREYELINSDNRNYTAYGNIGISRSHDRVLYGDEIVNVDKPLQSSYYPVLSNPLGEAFYIYDYMMRLDYGFYFFQSYLATINNLSPVTKTSAQTMKITYTVTETEE